MPDRDISDLLDFLPVFYIDVIRLLKIFFSPCCIVMSVFMSRGGGNLGGRGMGELGGRRHEMAISPLHMPPLILHSYSVPLLRTEGEHHVLYHFLDTC